MSAIKSTFQIAPNCYSAALLLLSAKQPCAMLHTHTVSGFMILMTPDKCFMIDQLQCQQEWRSKGAKVRGS